jgi:hypothetical protein
MEGLLSVVVKDGPFLMIIFLCGQGYTWIMLVLLVTENVLVMSEPFHS